MLVRLWIAEVVVCKRSRVHAIEKRSAKIDHDHGNENSSTESRIQHGAGLTGKGDPNLRENRSHTHQVNIELQALLRISDSYHSVIKFVSDCRIIWRYTGICVESTRTKRPMWERSHIGASAGGVVSHLAPLNGECDGRALMKRMSSERAGCMFAQCGKFFCIRPFAFPMSPSFT